MSTLIDDLDGGRSPDPSALSAGRSSGRHAVNIGHLVMGLAFLGLVGVWALVESSAVEGADVRWLLPVPWVLAGVAGLLATTLSRTRRSGRAVAAGQHDGPVPG